MCENYIYHNVHCLIINKNLNLSGGCKYKIYFGNFVFTPCMHPINMTQHKHVYSTYTILSRLQTIKLRLT